jgi:hypothetical protein
MSVHPAPLEILPPTVRSYIDLKAQLLAQTPDLDDETLHDTLEGASDLKELLEAVVRSVLFDEAFAEALSKRIADMKTRLDRLDVRAKTKRQVVVRAMTECDLRSLTAPDFTATVRKGAPSVDIHSEALIPAAYWKPQPPKLDKQSILAALKADAVVDGARLIDPQPQLSVRTR